MVCAALKAGFERGLLVAMKVVPANDGVHKWVAVFKDGKSVSFGAKGADDYTLTRDKEQRTRYRARHEKDLRSGDPQKPGFLSYYLLWGPSSSLSANIKAYEKKFKV
jgi:hypothetical protein